MKRNVTKVCGGGETKLHAFLMPEPHGSEWLALRYKELNFVIKNV
jgi:hypothetical protein